MSETFPAPDAPGDRLASLVHIMGGRWSPFSRLGVLELDAGQLTLRDARDTSLFAVPVPSIQVSPYRRAGAHRIFFRIHAAGRWWYLAAHVPTRYQRPATRELAVRYHAREVAPRPPGMGEDAYVRITGSPTSHQVMWAAWWLATLRTASQDS